MANPSQILGQNDPPVVPASATAVIGFENTASGPALLVSIAGGAFVVNVNLDLADDEVAIGGPDVGGTRRLFEGRNTGGGNNIIENVPLLIGSQALTLGKAEDTVHADGDVGVPAFAVRQDSPLSLVDADGDYTPLQTDGNGQLRVGGAAPTGLGKAEDAVHADGDVGVMALAVRRDAATAGAADGDYAAMSLDDQGWLRTRRRLGSTATTTTQAVAGVSTSLLGANASRLAATIQNRGPGPLYVALNAAATTSHFRLAPGEHKTWVTSPGVAINGISNGAGANAVMITEDV